MWDEDVGIAIKADPIIRQSEMIATGGICSAPPRPECLVCSLVRGILFTQWPARSLQEARIKLQHQCPAFSLYLEIKIYYPGHNK